MGAKRAGIASKRDSEDGETNKEGVSEMERGHSGVLVAEFILGPDASFAAAAVDGVYEAVGMR